MRVGGGQGNRRRCDCVGVSIVKVESSSRDRAMQADLVRPCAFLGRSSKDTPDKEHPLKEDKRTTEAWFSTKKKKKVFAHRTQLPTN